VRRVQERGLSYVHWGILTVVLVVAATYMGFAKRLPFSDQGTTLRATFKTANNIKPGSFVRIAGVNVGKVTEVDAVSPGSDAAVVTMELADDGLPIHQDATAKIRPRIFLEGNFFVDLSPGSPSAPVLEEGATLPIQQTSAPVQLDQVLAMLQTDVRRGLQDALDDLSRGFADGGAEGFRRSIKFWRPAYRDSAIVNDATLGVERDDLRGYLRGAAATAEGLDRRPERLRALIDDFATTAGAFAAEDAALRDAIAELPRTLRAAQPALGALNVAFPPLRRLAADLRPGVRSSTPTLRESVPFVRQLRGLVRESELRGLTRDLVPTVPALARLNERTRPLYEQVSLASSCQNEVILPWTNDKIEDPAFPARGRVFEEATKFLPGVAGESRSGDANGQWFRVLAGGGNFASDLGTGEVFLTDSPLLGTNPPKPAGRSPFRADVPCETQERPDLRTIPGAAPPSHRIRVPASRKAEYDAVVAQTVENLNRSIANQGLTGKLKAVTEPTTEATVKRLLDLREAGR
jgi:phospholipid/cholesterol/gamma-HCH transport system substrate-binding protein